MVQRARARGALTILLRPEARGYGAIHVNAYGGLRVAAGDLLSDRLHYSPQGHAKIAAQLLPHVERGLRGR